MPMPSIKSLSTSKTNSPATTTNSSRTQRPKTRRRDLVCGKAAAAELTPRDFLALALALALVLALALGALPRASIQTTTRADSFSLIQTNFDVAALNKSS